MVIAHPGALISKKCSTTFRVPTDACELQSLGKFLENCLWLVSSYQVHGKPARTSSSTRMQIEFSAVVNDFVEMLGRLILVLKCQP